ncbi:MAG: IS630 family transposase, partial [Candidatus Binatia bacterium]
LKACWCIPPDASGELVAAMEDVLEVYQRPHDVAAPVVCMDEICKQLVAETRCPIPAKPGQPRRIDYEYERRGVANVFMFAEPLAGWRWTIVTDQRTRSDWALAIKELLDVHYPRAQVVRLVMDNLNTHSVGSLYETFEPAEARRLAERLDIHYTPKHGSWLNIAEIELLALSTQCLDRRIADRRILEREVTVWRDERNASTVGVDWHFTTDDARIKLKRLYPVIRTG